MRIAKSNAKWKVELKTDYFKVCVCVESWNFWKCESCTERINISRRRITGTKKLVKECESASKPMKTWEASCFKLDGRQRKCKASETSRSRQETVGSCVWSRGGQLLRTAVAACQEFHYLKALHITTSHLCAFYSRTLSFQIIQSVFKQQVVGTKSFICHISYVCSQSAMY